MNRKLIDQWKKDRDEVIELLDVDRFKALYRCQLCKHFRLEVQQGGGCLEICEVTGGRVIGSDEVLNKSDNCPFMEVEDRK